MRSGRCRPAQARPGPTTGERFGRRTADDVAVQLSFARKVIVVPGYGMAVAQAQHDVRQLADLLEEKGVDVKYAIHPVAGRMPGHMNVLLAEANVPYTQLFEMDEINPEFPQTDVALVIGANDVTNPAARSDPGKPDLRHADPRRRQGCEHRRHEALDEPRVRRHRQRALPRSEDDDALRGREGVGPQADLRREVVVIPVFRAADVERAVSPHEAYDAVRGAFEAHARGTWSMPSKVYVTNYPAGDFRAMPAIGDGHAVLKWVTSFPGNPARGLPTVTGLVLLSDAEDGRLLAVLDAAAVTALRTAAAGVLAADTLCRSEASSYAVIGCGINGAETARMLVAHGVTPSCGTSTRVAVGSSPSASALAWPRAPPRRSRARS